MPLTRATVTVASRIMLPTYVGLATALGLVYVLDPGHRLADVHALAYPRQVMGGSMAPWGWVFLGLAATMLLAFTRRSRATMALGLCCCAVTMLMWAVMYTVSIFLDSQTSVLAPAYPLFVAIACFASTFSLLNGEI